MKIPLGEFEISNCDIMIKLNIPLIGRLSKIKTD